MTLDELYQQRQQKRDRLHSRSTANVDDLLRSVEQLSKYFGSYDTLDDIAEDLQWLLDKRRAEESP